MEEFNRKLIKIFQEKLVKEEINSLSDIKRCVEKWTQKYGLERRNFRITSRPSSGRRYYYIAEGAFAMVICYLRTKQVCTNEELQELRESFIKKRKEQMDYQFQADKVEDKLTLEEISIERERIKDSKKAEIIWEIKKHIAQGDLKKLDTLQLESILKVFE